MIQRRGARPRMRWRPVSTTGIPTKRTSRWLRGERRSMQRRVAITGIGVVAPGGVGTKEFWSLLSDGRTATRKITFFDPGLFRSQVAAEVDFDPEMYGLSPQAIRRMDRAAQFAVVTAAEAMSDSGLQLDDLDPFRTGVSVGSAVGATMGLDQEYREVSDGVMVAGATDAPISPITVACFDAIKATTPRTDDPAHSSRPFDRSRNGFVLGEGAAMFVLEEYERARNRGAHIYAEIAGYATRCNAFHMTGLRPDGREMAEAIR